MADPNRAVIFVDGSNWYHALERAGVRATAQLDYVKIATKLTSPRQWIGLRWYIGQIKQDVNDQKSTDLYRGQRAFVDRFEAQDARNKVFYGRMEVRTPKNEAAEELAAYLGNLKTRLPDDVFRDLQKIAKDHAKARVHVEKAVDVMLAVDMVSMALANDFDTAYLLSRDGDFTHAVSVIQGLGKKVFVASTEPAWALSQVCKFIKLNAEWFDDCHLPFEKTAPLSGVSGRPLGSKPPPGGAFGRGPRR